jgi:glucose/arabinose dehydrogenase
MRQVGMRWAVAAWAVGGMAGALRAQNIQPGTLTQPPQLRLVATVSASSGGGPTFGVHSGDSRFLYVGEQNGNVRILDFSQPNPLSATNFLNVDAGLAAFGEPGILDDTGTGERGLLGAAFHPDFNNAANPNGFRKFYTFTSETFASATPQHFHQAETPAYNHQSVIREWTANAPDGAGVTTINTAVQSRVVTRIAKPGPFHNGGGMLFGADGYLYVSLGDGGGGPSNGGNDGGNNTLNQGHTNPGTPDTPGGWTGQGNAQDRRNIYGKIIRIKPTTDADPATNPNTVGGGYRIPKSNPFTADTNAITPVPGWQDNWVDEIYAYGFRNPFRISIDRANPTRLYTADVGQDRNTNSREEVDQVVAGGNYGWVAKTGTELNNGATQAPYPIPSGFVVIDPIAQYPTTQLGQGGLAIIGGFIYRGTAIPELQGKYVFGDLNRGDGTGGRLLFTDLADPALQVFDINLSGSVPKPSGAFVHGVAEDARGEIYFLFGNGQVMQLVPEPSAAALVLLGGALACGRTARRVRKGR